MGNVIAVTSLENVLQTLGISELIVVKRGEYNFGLHRSSEMKQSSLHTTFLSGFLWLMVQEITTRRNWKLQTTPDTGHCFYYNNLHNVLLVVSPQFMTVLFKWKRMNKNDKRMIQHLTEIKLYVAMQRYPRHSSACFTTACLNSKSYL